MNRQFILEQGQTIHSRIGKELNIVEGFEYLFRSKEKTTDIPEYLYFAEDNDGAQYVIEQVSEDATNLRFRAEYLIDHPIPNANTPTDLADLPQNRLGIITPRHDEYVCLDQYVFGIRSLPLPILLQIMVQTLEIIQDIHNAGCFVPTLHWHQMLYNFRTLAVIYNGGSTIIVPGEHPFFIHEGDLNICSKNNRHVKASLETDRLILSMRIYGILMLQSPFSNDRCHFTAPVIPNEETAKQLDARSAAIRKRAAALWAILPSEIRDLFSRSFRSDALDVPDMIPSEEEWIRALVDFSRYLYRTRADETLPRLPSLR